MSEQDTEVTPVLFRVNKPRKGETYEVTAVFPTLPGDVDGKFMTCFAHIGQHGSCSLEWYQDTRPAKPDEFADLKRELEGPAYGYRLEIFERITPRHRAAFQANLNRERNASSARSFAHRQTNRP